MGPKANNKAWASDYYKGRLVETYIDGKSGMGSSTSAWRNGVRNFLQTAFLPEGYPDSVSKDYLGFQVWDTIQAVCSYIRGMLSSQAILRGVGVGKEAATSMNAVFQFAVRDLSSMIGGILFAYAEGASFDACAKQWRLFADVTNNFGMAIELASPFFPRAFLLMAIIGSVLRAIVAQPVVLAGVAGGATRAALTQHFALKGNAADVSAKEQSQETAVTAVGMALGMIFIQVTADHAAASWGLFAVLTVLHVHANIRAMRILVLKSLNQPRLDTLVKAYALQSHVPTPQEMSQLEPLTAPPVVRLLKSLRLYGPHVPPIYFGSRFSEVCGYSSSKRRAGSSSSGGGGRGGSSSSREGGAALLKKQLQQHVHGRYLAVRQHGQVQVVLHRAASTADMLQAYVHAVLLANPMLVKPSAVAAVECSTESLHQLCQQWMAERFDGFVAAISAQGWQADRLALPCLGWTAEWGNDHRE